MPSTECGLYLKSKGLSYEGIAHVLGKSEKHWYNVCQSLGRISLVGSTAKRKENLPKHLVADEKHSECQGKKSALLNQGMKSNFAYIWKPV